MGDIDADMVEGLGGWGNPRKRSLGPGEGFRKGGAGGGEPPAAEDRGKAAEVKHEREARAVGRMGVASNLNCLLELIYLGRGNERRGRRRNGKRQVNRQR